MDTIVNVKNAKFVVKDKNEHIQGHWMEGNFYEAYKTGLLSYLKRKGYSGRCLDIGASIGNHTMYFARMLGCDVVAVEPHPDSFQHLKENCELNNIDVELHNIALGQKQRKVSMENQSNKRYNVGMMEVVAGADVQMDLLDNVVSGQFDFIKIDVEHYNVPVLRGAENTLKAQKNCHVFIECETWRMLKDTDKIMQEYGYQRNEKVQLNHTPTYLWTKIQEK